VVDIYRREGSPFWYYDMTVDGSRKRRSTKRTKRSEALAVAAVASTRELDRAQLPQLRELTLREALFDHYLPTRIGMSSYVSLKRYCEYVCGDRKGIVGLGGTTKLHELTATMLRAYQRRRLASGMSKQSVDHELKVVSAAYHLLRGEYASPVALKFPLSRPKGKPRYLLPDEEAKLLADLSPLITRGRSGQIVALDPQSKAAQQRVDNYDLAVMLLDTGCRYGELASLQWAMVDTADWAWLHIYRPKVDNEGRLATTARVREVLQRRWINREGNKLVFPGWHLEGSEAPRQSTGAIRRAMARVGINDSMNVERFGRRDVRSLRDTFATKLRQKGMSLDRLQKLLGHASPEMTQKYAHLSVDHASAEAAALLDEINSESVP
jgi:integrase